MNKKRKNKRIFLFVFIAIAIAVSAFILSGKASSIILSLSQGGTVCDGELSGVAEHITDVPDGEVRFLINKSIVFENKFSLGDVMLENPESCAYDLKFLFYSPDGELIYASPLIAPGQSLEKDKLSAVVGAGEYQCTYSAQAYKNDVFMGEVTGIVTIRVGS